MTDRMLTEWTLQARAEAIRACDFVVDSTPHDSPWSLCPFNRIVVRDGLGWDGLVAVRALPTPPLAETAAWSRIILRTSATLVKEE